MDRNDRNEVRLRHCPMRRLHGACRWGGGAVLLASGQRGGGRANHNHRGPCPRGQAASRTTGLARFRRTAVRLLPERHDHGGGGIPQGETEADRRGHRQGDHQHLPLRNVSTGARGDPRRRKRVREAPMNYVPQINRRTFVVNAAALGGGLALGMDIPLGPNVVRAADGSPEVTAWVVIRPDDTVVIRIARSEMGQGTMTGLAQLVAEELECDWSKVTTEFPTPGQNLARGRVWGNLSTGGSRGIRDSHQYVREGGAAAREMLIGAAAAGWKVAPSECSAASGTITHKASGRTTTYGKVAEAAAKLAPPAEVKLK